MKTKEEIQHSKCFLEGSFEPQQIIVNTNINIILPTSKAPLFITVATPRLIIRTVIPEDVVFYQDELWGNQQVMLKFADGKTKPSGYAQKRIIDQEDSWCKRWINNNPWSGMTVLLKDTSRRIGSVVIGGGELAYLFIPPIWDHHYGSEAVIAVVNVLVPFLNELAIEHPFSIQMPEIIEATTRKDHITSQKILAKAGLKTDGIVNTILFGGVEHERYIFKVATLELIQQYKLTLRLVSTYSRPSVTI